MVARRGIIGLGLLVFGLNQTGCSVSGQDAMKVIGPAANTDAGIARNTVYLGPSNNVSLGSVWASTQGGFELKRIPPSLPWFVINTGNWVATSGTSNNSVSGGLTGDAVISAIPGLSAGLKASLSRAKSTDVKIDSWREVQIVGDDFAEWVKKPENDAYRRSLTGIDRVVAYRAIEVKGTSATLKFDGNGAADAHAQFTPPTPGTSGLASLNVGLNSQKTDANTLVITATEPFIVRVEMGRYNEPSGDFATRKVRHSTPCRATSRRS